MNSLCRLYDQIFKPSKLLANADFHLFKAGIEPKWDDPECSAGGKWSITSNRKASLFFFFFKNERSALIRCVMWLETAKISLEQNILIKSR